MKMYMKVRKTIEMDMNLQKVILATEWKHSTFGVVMEPGPEKSKA